MEFKAWFKSKTADKVLSPIRDELVELIAPASRVLEVGCGTGDLLFKLSGKVTHAVGVDIDQPMIRFAERKRERLGLENLEFFDTRIEAIDKFRETNFDVATATLCLHEMTTVDALATLNHMAKLANQVIVADFSAPITFGAKLGIEFDELISGHYSRFRAYRKLGYFPALAAQTRLTITSTIDTPMDGISIWVTRMKKNGVRDLVRC